MASIAADTPSSGRKSTRRRKEVQKLNYDEREEKKAAKPAFKVPKGAGMRLKDMERVADQNVLWCHAESQMFTHRRAAVRSRLTFAAVTRKHHAIVCGRPVVGARASFCAIFDS